MVDEFTIAAKAVEVFECFLLSKKIILPEDGLGAQVFSIGGNWATMEYFLAEVFRKALIDFSEEVMS